MHYLLEFLLQFFLGRFIRTGSITFTTSNGRSFTCGDGTGEPVAARFVSAAAERRFLLDPELAFGEIYTDGLFVMEKGSIADLLAIGMAQPYVMPRWVKLIDLVRYVTRGWHQFNTLTRSRRNIERHYDLDGRLYSLFLDADKQYSCAYFETPDSTLDDAQLAKKRHIAAKLLVRPGDRCWTSAPAGAASVCIWRR